MKIFCCSLMQLPTYLTYTCLTQSPLRHIYKIGQLSSIPLAREYGIIFINKLMNNRTIKRTNYLIIINRTSQICPTIDLSIDQQTNNKYFLCILQTLSFVYWLISRLKRFTIKNILLILAFFNNYSIFCCC